MMLVAIPRCTILPRCRLSGPGIGYPDPWSQTLGCATALEFYDWTPLLSHLDTNGEHLYINSKLPKISMDFFKQNLLSISGVNTAHISKMQEPTYDRT
jgi:hypothetical protein